MDGDGRANLVFWSAITSGGYFQWGGQSKQWGNASLGDVPLLGDLDGDGLGDLVVWRASTGTWYWLTSSTGYDYAQARGLQWGNASLGDQPLLGDMDGDGFSDLAVWRASTGTWYWLTSSSGYDYRAGQARQWGNTQFGDWPMLGDIDGDARADLVVWRASTATWYWVTSASGYDYDQAGGVHWEWGGTPILTDMDGDQRIDLMFSGSGYRWLTSSTGYDPAAARAVSVWGEHINSTLRYVLGDFDGDGRGDPGWLETRFTVCSSSTTWKWWKSSTNFTELHSEPRRDFEINCRPLAALVPGQSP
jgi:hypothetical protein